MLSAIHPRTRYGLNSGLWLSVSSFLPRVTYSIQIILSFKTRLRFTHTYTTFSFLLFLLLLLLTWCAMYSFIRRTLPLSVHECAPTSQSLTASTIYRQAPRCSYKARRCLCILRTLIGKVSRAIPLQPLSAIWPQKQRCRSRDALFITLYQLP